MPHTSHINRCYKGATRCRVVVFDCSYTSAIISSFALIWELIPVGSDPFPNHHCWIYHFALWHVAHIQPLSVERSKKDLHVLNFPSPIIIFTAVIISIIWKIQLPATASSCFAVKERGCQKIVSHHFSAVCIDFQFDAWSNSRGWGLIAKELWCLGPGFEVTSPTVFIRGFIGQNGRAVAEWKSAPNFYSCHLQVRLRKNFALKTLESHCQLLLIILNWIDQRPIWHGVRQLPDSLGVVIQNGPEIMSSEQGWENRCPPNVAVLLFPSSLTTRHVCWGWLELESNDIWKINCVLLLH